MRARAFALPALVLAIGACSGEVISSNGDAGGTGASGTGGAGAAGTGGTGGAAGPCPEGAPVEGSPCSAPEGTMCSYGSCCPDVYGCQGGVWHGLLGDCPATQCPPAAPAVGASCDVCFQQSPCTYDLCDSAQGIATFVCDVQGTWAPTTTDPCPGPSGCGNQSCGAGEVCVRRDASITVKYECAPDPCAPQPLSCDCAAVLCVGPTNVCTGVMGNEVDCLCPSCE